MVRLIYFGAAMPAWFYKFTILTLVTALSILTWSMFSAPNVQAHKTIPAAVTELAVTVNSEQTSFTTEKLVLGLGCFWGAEKRFEALPGVMNVVSGYADGRGFAPTYQNIIKAKHRFNPDNYAEVIEITYNPQQISTQTLIKAFYEMHDPTQQNRQGNDIGTNYRSTILYTNDAQQTIAQALTAEFQNKLNAAGYGAIQTIIKALDTFHPAEDYHQDYIAKNPNGYCPDHSTGVTFSGEAKRIEMLDNAALLEGKHIVVIDSPDCPYCDKFKAEVAATYAGSIPMHFRLAEQLTGLSISSPTWATPTLLFLENGTEVHGVQGFVNRTDFYKLVGAFKLGQSEAFDVAFNKGTDARFCKQYEAFKNVGEGTFIDTLSGAPLFDTDYQFNSGSGWLSFTQAVKDSVTYHEDLSYGMVRTEIRAAKSGIHLGHVFDDGPSGKPRYCINATVLEFKPRI
jgi:peptide methionine sulfoxide reductase msrA/msrB